MISAVQSDHGQTFIRHRAGPVRKVITVGAIPPAAVQWARG